MLTMLVSAQLKGLCLKFDERIWNKYGIELAQLQNKKTVMFWMSVYDFIRVLLPKNIILADVAWGSKELNESVCNPAAVFEHWLLGGVS